MPSCTETALQANTKIFAWFGNFVASKKGSCICMTLGILITTIFCVGMYKIEYEDDLDNLWIEEGSRAEEEDQFLKAHFGGDSRLNLFMLLNRDSRLTPNSATDFGLLTSTAMLAWRDATADIQSNNVNQFAVEVELPVSGTPTAVNITLADICDRPFVPSGLKTWTGLGLAHNNPATVGTWLAAQTVDSGSLHFMTNCLGARAATVLGSQTDPTLIDPTDYIQLQMWYQETDIDTVIADTPGKAAIIAARPGYRDGFGITRFPCTRAHILDCWREGEYDAPDDMLELGEYALSLGALADIFTIGDFSGLGLPFVPQQLAAYSTDFSGGANTWYTDCKNELTAILDGIDPTTAASQTVIGSLDAVAITVATGFGWYWRPTVAEHAGSGDNVFAYNFYQSEINGQLNDAATCVAEGVYRQMAFIQRHTADANRGTFGFYDIAAFTPMDGGCCIAWPGSPVVAPLLYAGGVSPPNSLTFLTDNPAASASTFQGFIAGFRITNSNTNHRSPFLKVRLNEERSIDTTVSDAQLENAIDLWEQGAVNFLEARFEREAGTGFEDGGTFAAFHLNFLVDRSVKDLFDDAAKVEAPLLIIGYLVLIIYACGTFVQFGTDSGAIVYSRGLLCFFGIVCIGFATAASYGIVSWFDLTLSPVNSTLVPFLSMGLGIDDLFVLMHEYLRSHNEQDYVHNRMVITLMNAGSSITVTSAANFAAFLIPAILVRLPAVYTFSYQMAAAVALNWFVLMTIFAPVMVMDAHRSQKRKSFMPCIATANKAETTVLESGSKYTLANFVKQFLCPLYVNKIFKAVVLLIWIGLTIWLGIHGAENTERGLRLSDVTIKGSYVKEYLTAQEELFPLLPGNMVTREVSFQDPNNAANTIRMDEYQEHLLALIADGQRNRFVEQVQTLEGSHWLPGFIARGWNALPDSVLTGVFGVPVADVPLFPRPSTTVPTALFYPALQFYLNGVGATSTDALVCRTVATGALGPCNAVDGTTVQIVATKGALYYDNLFTDQDNTDAIQSLRATLDGSGGQFDDCCNAVNNGTRLDPIQGFFSGFLFKFWQQYVTIEELAFKTIGFGLLGIAIVLLIFQASPLSSFLVVLMLVASVFQLYGVMELIGVKLNGFSVTNLSIALGMGVEFTAHIAYSFLRSSAEAETRDERMQLALVDIFPPMMSGALTTFISVIALAFAKYPFFSLYFFEMIAVMIVIMFLNGMVVLPVILSLVGPKGLSKKDVKNIAHIDDHDDNTEIHKL